MPTQRFRFMLLILALLTWAAGPLHASVRAQGEAQRNGRVDGRFQDTETATFAGGCFWCVEADFEKVPGVLEVISGYTGGHTENPTYEEVSAGGTGHLESVQVIYDPAKVTYSQLLDYFWHHVNPTDPGGQFVDRGNQYRSAIFYHDEEQKRLAEESKRELEDSGHFSKPIVTEILPFKHFYKAEAYHQDYYKKHSLKYSFYRWNSGRDQFLEKTWGEAGGGVAAAASRGKEGKGHLQ